MKLLAFLGRYGHQPINLMLALPVTTMMKLADEVGNLIKEENDPVRSRLETDG